MNVTNKIVFLGDSSVGKTSIINSFFQDIFIQEQAPTIGAFVTTKSVNLDDGKEVTLNIWDTAGQERYRALAPMYFRDANIAILVYAINSKDSFEKLRGWIDNLENNTTIMPHLIIVGNKTDLVEERTVQFNEALEFAEASKATFFECSAKLSEGINELFHTAANIISQMSSENNVQSDQPFQNINDNENQAKTKKGCC